MTKAVKERGILMHARSVDNILAGRKTQTRRIVKPQPLHNPDSYGLAILRGNKHEWWALHDPDFPTQDPVLRCPYGQPGDRLWVRETFRPISGWWHGDASDEGRPVEYRASAHSRSDIPWRPSLFMPRWASRITLEIADVRVQRVQDITAEDALAEGIEDVWTCAHPTWTQQDLDACVARFAALWNDTNGADAWKRNDWCWCLTFRCAEVEP